MDEKNEQKEKIVRLEEMIKRRDSENRKMKRQLNNAVTLINALVMKSGGTIEIGIEELVEAEMKKTLVHTDEKKQFITYKIVEY